MLQKKMLEGLRVVEQGAFITGPYAAMLLADMGADVIKVERPEGGDPFRNFEGGLYSPHFQAYNRNKRSVTIDARDPKDLATLDALIESADVFIQNFRPGVADKLKVDYARLKAINPDLIYCSISGFGADGPYLERPSYDTVAQALSGFLNMLLDPENPRVAGPALADAVTGLYAAQGVLAALFRRAQDGGGHLVEVSMLEAMTHFAIEPYSNYFHSGKTPGPFGRAAVSQSYVARCADGRMLALHLSSPEKFWTGLLTALERPELGTDPRFATRQARIQNHDALRLALQGVFAERPREEWLARLISADVPCAPVHDLDETLADPQAQHLGLEVTAEHPIQGKLRTIRPAIGFDGFRETSFTPPPVLGEHNDTIRREIANLGPEADAASSQPLATAVR
jgi:crotonobetainyl-CoA:carnitine CoA-transferase CaiB-like acyl-CoA transferase